MSRIRGKNTQIEQQMEKILTDAKYKFEAHPKIFGNPDFVLRKKKIIIFCDGDFWHGYKYYEKKRMPKKFWRDKIENNMKRDQRYTRKLREDGWSVLRFWEHDIRKKPEKCLKKIKRKVKEKQTH